MKKTTLLPHRTNHPLFIDDKTEPGCLGPSAHNTKASHVPVTQPDVWVVENVCRFQLSSDCPKKK